MNFARQHSLFPAAIRPQVAALAPLRQAVSTAKPGPRHRSLATQELTLMTEKGQAHGTPGDWLEFAYPRNRSLKALQDCETWKTREKEEDKEKEDEQDGKQGRAVS